MKFENLAERLRARMIETMLGFGHSGTTTFDISLEEDEIVATLTTRIKRPHLIPEKPGLKDEDEFYDAVRDIFGGSFNNTQFSGMKAIVACLTATKSPISWAAYMMATIKWETNSAMVPAWESLNYSVSGLMNTFSRERISEQECNAYGRTDSQAADQVHIGNCVYGGQWGYDNLGNTEPSDGYDKRGCGLVQCTGRANDEKLDAAMGTGTQLQDDHGKLMDPMISAYATFYGMSKGIFTGVSLSETLPGAGTPATHDQMEDARAIINGVDHANDIANVAIQFQNAFTDGGWPY